jgi:hypothetical protein
MTDHTAGHGPDMRLSRGTHAGRKEERRWYLLLLAATYPFFLVAVLIDRLLGLAREPDPRASAPRVNVFGEAWSTARSTLPFAFMG